MISKFKIIEEIIKYKNEENANVLDNVVFKISELNEEHFFDILKNIGIKNNTDIPYAISKMVALLENTKFQRTKGEYVERIKNDSVLYDIYLRASETEFGSIKEMGYFVYHELCSILKENTASFFEEEYKRIPHYNDLLSYDYSGICKNMSEVYADMMEMLGQRVELVVRDPVISNFSHIDAILFDDENNERYFMNLIGDIYRVRSKRICKLYGGEMPESSYRIRIESIYGALTPVSEEEIRTMDEKLEYIKQDEKYTNEIVDELLSKEKGINLTFFERIYKYIEKSNEEFKTMHNTGYIEATQHFRNPVIKMAFKKIISREDYFSKFIGFDCIRNESLMNMQWLLMVWNENDNNFSYFSLNAGKNQLLEKKKEDILQDLKSGKMRILKPALNDRTLSIEEYDDILSKYFNVADEQKRELLLAYKKQIVINTLKIINNDEESALINEKIKKRIQQIVNMSLQDYECNETKVYQILQNLRKSQFNRKTNVVDMMIGKIQADYVLRTNQEIIESEELEN